MCVFCPVHSNPIPHFLEHPETMLDLMGFNGIYWLIELVSGLVHPRRVKYGAGPVKTRVTIH